MDNDLVLTAIDQLGQLTAAFQARRRQLAASAGLTEQQWAVLEEVATPHFMPSLFARQRDSSPAAVSKILRQLLEKGLVRVGLSASDGRQRNYELTDAGSRALSQIRSLRERAIDTIWRQLEPTEVQRFSTFCADLLARFAHYADGSAAPEAPAPASPWTPARPEPSRHLQTTTEHDGKNTLR